MTRDHSTRRGVTLIEVMVAMALTLVIMLILAEAFKSSLDFVRSANSTGTMISHLNGAGTILTRDLNAEHFLPEDVTSKPNGGLRLSDQRLDWAGSTLPGKVWGPPRGGFFRIESPAPTSHGVDQDGFNITTAANHVLHFTSVLPGGSDQNLFAVRSPAGAAGTVYSSRAAEIAYFLVETGQTDPGPSGRKVYNLIRRYRLIALDDQFVNSLTAAVADTDVISVPNPNPTNTVNTLATVATPANRMPHTAFGAANARYGEDILLSNVLSFEVLADWTPNPATAAPYAAAAPRPFTNAGIIDNSDSPYDYLPGAGVFDTSNPALYVRVKTIQVTIRVWDPRMKQARQNTWKFAM